MNDVSQEGKSSALRFFKWVGILLLVLVIGLIVAAAVFEKQIGAVVIKTLNKQIKTELKVEEATLSLIRQFPKAAVYLNNVELSGAGDKEQKLLKVESISLKCSIIGLLTGNYDFKSIAINDGYLFIHTDKKGKANYDVLSASETEETAAESGDLNLSIADFTMKNLLIHYVDETAKHDIKLTAKTAYFQGNFMVDNKQNMDKYSMSSYAELLSEHIKIDETTYLVGKNFAYDGSLVLDNMNGLYTFNNIELFLQGNEFKVDGTIEQNKKGTNYNLTFDSDNTRLNSIMNLLPSQYTSTLGGLESHAKLHFDAKVNGLYSKKSTPEIKVNFGLKEGRLTHPDLVGSMKNVKFDVNFTNGDGINDKTAKLELKGFQGIINSQPVNMNYTMTGLKNPVIDMSLTGRIPLGAIYKFLGEDFTDGSGNIHIEQLNLNGDLKDMMSMYRVPRVKLNGIINLEEASVTANAIATTLEKGKLTLKDNIFNVVDLSIKTPNNQILLNGNFQNALPVLLSDSLNSENAKLTFKASLTADKMDVDELVAFSLGNSEEEIEDAPEEQQDSLVKDNQAQREQLTSFLKGSFYTSIGELRYGKVTARNFKGEIAFENSVMDMKGVRAEAMNGVLELNSKVHFLQEPYVEAFLDCKDIDMQEFLGQLDNFGQDVLTDQNLHGKLQSLIKVNVYFDSLGNLKTDELFVVADVKINKGELINFKMLESFASLIKVQDLQNIRFTELQNQFKIENGKMHIPAMFIQSNALNLVVGGVYSFNHDMDFKIKVNAGQVIANKFKKYNPGKEPIKARQKGLFNIYAHIYGNLYNDYQYKLGPKDTKDALEAQLNSQLPVISNTLKAEFSKSGLPEAKKEKVQKMTEPAAWSDIPEYEEGKIEEEYIEGF